MQAGLSAEAKYLSSKYFYDSRGDKLFQAIMASPEYYLTDAEHEILTRQQQAILDSLPRQGFDLVELGSGDGKKTRVLLQHFYRQGVDLRYLPIDISASSLEGLRLSLAQELPELPVLPIAGEYLSALSCLPASDHPRVFMFLGSNIGNFNPDGAVDFLSQIHSRLEPRDYFFIGADLKKHPNKILSAYNDAGGVTRAFNLNLLRRINRELGGDFQLDQFEHYPTYDPQSGATKSFLVSARDQQVHIAALEQTFEFRTGETIFMEISQKYSLRGLKRVAERAGFQVLESFVDSREYFVDQLWSC